MGWVALDRAISIAHLLGETQQVDEWGAVRDEIHADVMERGWSERLGSFRQRYEGDNLDASALLIPVMGFLPADHARVTATIEQIASRLTINGFVYRFVPRETPGGSDLPLGQHEGAFLPCTFWLATSYARLGQTAKAEATLRRAEAVAGSTGLFAEAVDPRSGSFLGNSPLLFSHTEYLRAMLELEKARGA
jgi:GH15 family glucan-1,4-alpha-glucosidase